MAKDLIYSSEARTKLFTGIEKVAKAVKTTLGPAGRYVMLEKKNSSPVITKDGVTAAKDISLEDPVENLGASLLKEVASKTNDVAGDNTTTSTVLAYAIVKEGLKAITAGERPIEIKRGIDKATTAVIDALIASGKTVSDTKEITNVATISANNDPEIGSVLAEAINKVGKDGVITVEESKNVLTSVRTVDGLQFDEGYINPYFSTDKERLVTEFDSARILITDKKISSMQELMPVLEPVVQSGSPLMIICDDCDGEALGTLILNSVRGTIKAVVVKAPSFGDNRKNILQDIAVLTGATVVSDELSMKLENTTMDMLGTGKVKITKDSTTIINGGGDPKALEERVNELKAQVNSITDEYTKGKIKSRIAKLTGGVAIVEVGAATETELKEKKFRVEDTIAATKAALEEGIVPGGGVALVNARRKLKTPNFASSGEAAGYAILMNALAEPMKQIAENAGVNGEVVFNEVFVKNTEDGFGYDAKNNKYCDMMEAGIIDTVKAIRYALANASSIAGMILTTECAVTDIPKDEPMMPTPMGPMPY